MRNRAAYSNEEKIAIIREHTEKHRTLKVWHQQIVSVLPAETISGERQKLNQYDLVLFERIQTQHGKALLRRWCNHYGSGTGNGNPASNAHVR